MLYILKTFENELGNKFTQILFRKMSLENKWIWIHDHHDEVENLICTDKRVVNNILYCYRVAQ